MRQQGVLIEQFDYAGPEHGDTESSTSATGAPRCMTAFEGRLGAYIVLSYPLRRSTRLTDLTEAERAVAQGIISGLSIRDLAEQRNVSHRTIGNQLGSIYRKLRVASRYELIALSVQ